MAYPNSITRYTTKIDKNASGYLVGPEYFNVPSATPYEIYLDHVPKDSSTTVIGASGGATWTEVLVTPTSADHYLVDYTTGKLTFHSGNANSAAQASYKCLGDDIMAEHINSLQDNIVQIQEELGEDPSGPYATVQTRLNNIDASVTASGLNGQRITDNTVRAGALMSDIKGSSWATVGRPVLTDIPAHVSNATAAHAATAISATGPDSTAITTVQGHISQVGNGTAVPTNPHALAYSDIAKGDINVRPTSNMLCNVSYAYQSVTGSILSSGHYTPDASGTRSIGSWPVPIASGFFDTVYAGSGGYRIGSSIGAAGSFTSADGKTITVKAGLIVSIV